jgi:hypothetical protein
MSSLIYLSLFAIFYGFLSWRRPDYALYLLLILLPTYQIRFSIFGYPSTLLELMILISFFVFVIKNNKDIIQRIKNKFIRHSSLVVRNSRRYPFDIEIVLLLIISWVEIFIAGFTPAALGVWKAYFLEPVLVYILIFNMFKYNANDANDPRMTRINIEKILWPLFVSAFGVSVFAIFQKISGVLIAPQFWPRVTGPFVYPNAMGLFLGPIVALLAGYAILQITNYKLQITNKFPTSNIKYQKLLYILLILLLSIIAIFFASSEGAMIGLVVSFFVCGLFVLFGAKPKLKWVPVGFLSLIMVFVIFSSAFYLKVVPEYKYFNFKNPVLNYISDKAMLKDFSGEVRKQQWRETWRLLTASPKNFIFGVGLSNYQASVKPYHQEGIFFNSERDPRFRNEIVWGGDAYKAAHWRPVEIYFYPHNIVLNFWSELGLMGVLLFMWIIGKTLFLIFNFQFSISNSQIQKSNKARYFLVLGLLGAVIVLVVHGIVDVPYFKNDLAVLFWVLIAIVGILNFHDKKNG